MKKALSLIAVLFCILQISFAEAPELKNMMPNSWRKLTRLSEDEEKEFLNQQEIKDDIGNFKSDSWTTSKFDIQEKRIYKEVVNNIEFYRFLVCNQNMADFLAVEYKDITMPIKDYEKIERSSILQNVYFKTKSGKIIKLVELQYRVYGITDSMGENKGGNYFKFYDIFIKELNTRELGFFITEVSTGFQTEYNGQTVTVNYSKLKEQIQGQNNCDFFRCKNTEDLEQVMTNNNRRITIQASMFLFDSRCPLKYSIQNAFDGNPATSYVENTEDDLMKIDVWLGEPVDEMAIINGYASSEMLYKSNNRIKQVANYFDLKDNCLSYQYIPCRGTNVSFTAIYKGLKYNDTCIAELNYLFKNNWLFGDIDE